MSGRPRPRQLTAGLIGLLALLSVAAGCGRSGSEEEKVESTVTGFLDDVASGKGEDACARLTGSAIDELSAAAFLLQAPASCAEAIELANGALSDQEKKAYKNAKVNRVTLTGNRATVADNDIELELDEGRSGLFRNNDPKPVELEKADDNWRISSFG